MSAIWRNARECLRPGYGDCIPLGKLADGAGLANCGLVLPSAEITLTLFAGLTQADPVTAWWLDAIARRNRPGDWRSATPSVRG